MEYMESVKELEEKLLANQQRHGRDDFINDNCTGEVIFLWHLLLLRMESYDCCQIEIYEFQLGFNPLSNFVLYPAAV